MNPAPNPARAKVLIAPWHRPSLANMARLYKLYAEQAGIDPCLLAINRDIARELRGLVGDDAAIHEYFIDQAADDYSRSGLARLMEGALHRLAPSWVSSFRQCRRRLQGSRRLARAILQKTKPALMVVEDDRRLDLLPLIHEARKLGCRVLVIPYGISSTKKDLLVERQGRPDKLVRQGSHRLVKSAVARIWPQTVIGRGPQAAFFYRAEEVLALRSLSMLPASPFDLGASSDLVVVGGEFDHESLRQNGVAAGKLVIAGELEHDELAEAARQRSEIRDRIIQKYNLTPAKKIVVVCIPQIQNEHLMPLPKQEAERRRLVGAACGENRNVLLSLHPRLDPSECGDLTAEFPAVVLEEKLKDVIAAADLYISNHSSTVRWCILLRVPTVVVDFNGHEEKIFSDLSPALRFCSMDELFDEVKSLLEQPGALETQQQHQEKLEGFFGRLDGLAGRRVLDTTTALLASGRAQW